MRRPARKFALCLCVLSLLAAPAAPVLALSVEGSAVTLTQPGDVCGGIRYIFRFQVFNGSPDEEWLDEIEIAFPPGYGIDPASASIEEGFSGPWAFEFRVEGADGNIAIWRDADGEYGEIWSGDSGVFTVEVDVPAGILEGPQLSWRLSGDDWADPPHDVTGNTAAGLCSTATAVMTWSSLKSLYR